MIDKKIHSASHTAIEGYVTWEVINEDGSVASRGEHKNLILNAGLDKLATQQFATMFENNCVGTGSSTPIVTQIGLDNEVARTNSYLTSPSGSCGTTVSANALILNRTFNWAAGTLDTSISGPLTEVGFSWSTSAGSNLWSRSLFKNTGGTPINVFVTSTQQLRVTYTLTVYVSTADWTDGVVTITGIGDVAYQSRAQQAGTVPSQGVGVPGLSQIYTSGGSNASAIQNFEPCATGPNASGYPNSPSFYSLSFATSSYPTAASLPTGELPGYFGTNIGSPSLLSWTRSSYTPGSFSVTRTFTVDVNTANGNIQWIFGPGTAPASSNSDDLYRPIAYFFPTPIAKDNLHTLTLTFSFTWGRA